MRYEIYLNQSPDNHPMGYKPGDKMKLVYSGDLSGVYPQTLTKIFEIFNIAHPEDYTGRSLSVGDVVVLLAHGEYIGYACEMVGWKTIRYYDMEATV